MKGLFTPKNPTKYLGRAVGVNTDGTPRYNIVFRSSWELMLFKYLDSTPAVRQWSSEEFSIPYLSPVDARVHQYYPDALVVYVDKTQVLKKELIEIKPYKETVLTPRSSPADKQAWVINQAKWKAAAAFCQLNGMTFRVVTEKTMFANGRNK
jgi:hypothetical protein